MNINKKMMAGSQPKITFTRISNNLRKLIDNSVTLKTVKNKYNEFKDVRKQVQRKHDKYMEGVTEQIEGDKRIGLTVLRMHFVKELIRT